MPTKLPPVKYEVVSIALIDDLEAKNPNDMDVGVYNQVKHNIGKYGFLQPIVLYKKGKRYVLIDGWHRRKVMTELGETAIPAMVAMSKRVAEKVARILRMSMNQARGQTSFDAMMSEVNSMIEDGVSPEDLPETGISVDELAVIRDASNLDISAILGSIATGPIPMLPDPPASSTPSVLGTTSPQKLAKCAIYFDSSIKKRRFEEWLRENGDDSVDQSQALLAALNLDSD